MLKPGEPLWLESDTDEALALHAYEASICPGCGQPKAEAQAVDDKGRPLYGYKVTEYECQGCRAISGRDHDNRGHDHPTALRYALERFDAPRPR